MINIFLCFLITLAGCSINTGGMNLTQISKSVQYYSPEELMMTSTKISEQTRIAREKSQQVLSKEEMQAMKDKADRVLASARRFVEALKAQEAAQGSMVYTSSQIIDAGEASTYGWGEKLNTHTFSGERFDPDGVSVAMREIPMGTVVRIIDVNTGNSIFARVNDGGPAERLNRLIDLSKGAWMKLGYNKPGLTKVQVEVLRLGTGRSCK